MAVLVLATGFDNILYTTLRPVKSYNIGILYGIFCSNTYMQNFRYMDTFTRGFLVPLGASSTRYTMFQYNIFIMTVSAGSLGGPETIIKTAMVSNTMLSLI